MENWGFKSPRLFFFVSKKIKVDLPKKKRKSFNQISYGYFLWKNINYNRDRLWCFAKQNKYFFRYQISYTNNS
jgi:hypothetical protein